MQQEKLSRGAVRAVLHAFWQQYRAHPFLTAWTFLLPAIGIIFVFFVPPLILAKIVNTIAETKNVSLNALWPLLALMGGVWFAGELCWRAGLYALTRLEAHGITELSRYTFRALMAREYAFYTNNFTGSLTKKATAFPRTFESFTDTLCFSIVGNLVSLIFAFVILWRYTPLLPLALMGCLILVVSITIPLIKKRSALVAKRHEAGSRVSGRLSDVIANATTVKSFATEKEEQVTFEKDVSHYVHFFKKASDWHNLRIDFSISPLYVGANILGLIIALYFVQHEGLQVGAVVLIFSYYNQIARVFWETNRIYRNIESSIGEAAEFTELMLEPPAITDAHNAKEITLTTTPIVFSQAGFSYNTDGENEQFLSNFNLSIGHKEKVGLVGPSGSGKTTITKLLLRFADIQSGSITIDGIDIRTLSQASLRKAIAYVPQDPLLFHRTLFENIAYGKAGATEEEVIHAARLAHAHEFINTMPQGYQTLVGERGVKLSGGQRQRIAIARAILKNAPILILDEATSALDSESEKYIQEGLQELMKEKTTLVIAHRLSTIKNLDRIIVLDHGNIIQEGTHEVLSKEKGLYATLWSHQTGEILEE